MEDFLVVLFCPKEGFPGVLHPAILHRGAGRLQLLLAEPLGHLSSAILSSCMASNSLINNSLSFLADCTLLLGNILASLGLQLGAGWQLMKIIKIL